MANKHRKTKKAKGDISKADVNVLLWSADRELENWLEPDGANEFEPDENYFVPSSVDLALKQRLELIKESHALLKQFTPKELKALIDLKRNSSPKAWSLREDLVVLTVPMSNREIAERLKDRNKEAVKKRLQLLKSKGLSKRQLPNVTPPSRG
ncbi:MAG TPA: hypothetical protein VMC85_03715 [Desulfomonilaceae bacterium]|nr:hypothetical protein [Desulfomonilaceae bacterium]